MIIVILLYGLICGSFVNALVWRLRQQGKGQRAKDKGQSLSILRGRSMCPDCRHTLAARDLVPVLSWLSLRGRCRYCQKPISVQYPLVELLTGLLFVVFYLGWTLSLSGLHLIWFLYGLVYVVFFVALAVYDFKWFLLPDKLVFPLIGVAASQVLVTSLWQQSLGVLWMSAVGAGLYFGLFWGLYQASDGKWIGGGDVKLALALGLIAGSPLKVMLALFIASLIGTLVSIPQIAGGKHGLKQHIPFGPYLLAGTFVVMVWGERLVNWYTGQFL
ncbi:prepilin peptidase [Candidatus Saccharibacteria bacterium]|nr:MAG: prepilin peptidase [Candidatus Saccharibacteria bacterium]